MPVLFYALAALVLAADQASKLVVASSLQMRTPLPVIPGYLDFTYVVNRGGAFGLMPWATWMLVAVACLVIIALVAYGRRLAEAGLLVESATAMILGGALGNLLDRVRLGHVVDFIDVHFWPVFNVADIAITAGAFLLIVAMLRGTPSSTPPPEE
ncbi:MAG: signal peptidase II [Armatimonadetes bacterium]|nr:signal peptidase II [Armatimonadota bacterium]